MLTLFSMANPSGFGILLVLELILLPLAISSHLNALKENSDSSPLPTNFLFGTASSSYQFEGAYLRDGKGLSNWDIFAHQPGHVVDGSNGDVAVDQYDRYLEDIALLDNLGVNSYRFSISWSRILPRGRFGDVNSAGISYYNMLIDALLLRGIQPFVTLCHFDWPHELEQRYGSWLSPEAEYDFAYYADICFKHFGDRVKYWVTFNEPNLQVIDGYRNGQFPPSRCSSAFGNCTCGDSEKEPFVAAHNIILSHANAVDIYKTKYQKVQGGSIGIILQAIWFEPINNSTADKLAAERALAFYINWFLDPIVFGRYPREMIKILGPSLPLFSSQDREKLKKNGLGFIGVNHYNSLYIQDCISSVCEPGIGSTKTEGFCRQSKEKDGIPLGDIGGVDWQNIYPEGFEKIITYIKQRYNNMPMIITENGYGQVDSANLTIAESLDDVKRVNYISSYWNSLLTAMRKGANVRGYFVWSFLDNFEWMYGYTVRFGLHHVHDATKTRTKRLSATWFQQLVAKYKIAKSKM